MSTILLFSCNEPSNGSPAHYNDFVIEEIEGAAERMRAFYASDSKSDEQLDGVKNFILATLERLENEDSPESPTYIKKASLDILQFYLRLCEEDNLNLLSLTDPIDYTSEDSLQTQQLITQIIKESNLLNSDFVAAQKKFASDNNLLLVNNFIEAPQ